MTSAIVLAAGMSTRMGTLKQLLPFGKSTVLGSVIENLRVAGLDRVVVVLGHEANKVRESIATTEVEFVTNEDHVLGMFSSVQTGLRALSSHTEAFLFGRSGCTSIRGQTIRALIGSFTKFD